MAAQADNFSQSNYTFTYVSPQICVSSSEFMQHTGQYDITATWQNDGFGNLCRFGLVRGKGYIKNALAFYSNGNLCGAVGEQTTQRDDQQLLTSVGFSISPWCPGHATMDSWNWAAYGSNWYPAYAGGPFLNGVHHDF